MFERWLKAPSGNGSGNGAAAKVAAPKSEAGAAPGANTKPWELSIGTVAVDNGALSYSDKAGATPVAFEVTALKVNAQKIAPNTAAVSPLQLSGRIGAGRAEAGRFDYKGTVALKPMAAEGRLEVAAFPAHAFKAYYAEALNIDIRRAFANYRGTVKFATAPAGMSVKLAGDTALDDFRANSASLTQSPGLATRSNQILSWKTLSLRGLQVDMVPSAPLAVNVRETTLTDFFARAIVDPTGRLNLQDLTRKPGQATAAAAPAEGQPTTRRSLGGTTTTTTAKPAARSGGAPVSAEAMVGGGPETAPAAPAVVAKAQAPDSGGPAPVINFGPMSLVNGRIDFTDLFVRPNYSADLSELTGKLSAFSSRPQGDRPALADLELRGKAQQTAQLEITGKLNPLAKPLELDITAKMRELDLPPLSPYSVRYAGHGIERGKLSMSVNYKITPDGQLTATNKLVLNQLQFGDEVQGAPNSLPVRLAVALLADRNGVIDIDFPVSGSLNDPQFSIGPLIFKAIVNLIVKAATAPFALLTGGLGGGSGESSAIAFAPGSSVLAPAAKESLDKVAKALTDRPGLQMTVVGTASLEQEREAYQRQRLRAARPIREAPCRGAQRQPERSRGHARHRRRIPGAAGRGLQTLGGHQAAQHDRPGEGTAHQGDGRPADGQHPGRRGVDAAAGGGPRRRGPRLPAGAEVAERATVPRGGAHQGIRQRLETRCRTESGDTLKAGHKSVKMAECAGKCRRLRFSSSDNDIRAVTSTSTKPNDLQSLDTLTGGAFTAPTSGERAQRVRDWLAGNPEPEQMQEVFKELSGRDKGAARLLREKLDELKRAKGQEAIAAEWAQKAEALLGQPKLNIADALAWQRDAAKAGAPLSREPLASFKAQLAERVKGIEDLQHRAQVHREAAVLLAQRFEVLSTKGWRDAQAAEEALRADVAHWQQQAAEIAADANWNSLDAKFAPQLEVIARPSCWWCPMPSSSALAQAIAAAADAAAPLPPVPVWADELRVARGGMAEAAAPAAQKPAAPKVDPEKRAAAQAAVRGRARQARTGNRRRPRQGQRRRRRRAARRAQGTRQAGRGAAGGAACMRRWSPPANSKAGSAGAPTRCAKNWWPRPKGCSSARKARRSAAARCRKPCARCASNGSRPTRAACRTTRSGSASTKPATRPTRWSRPGSRRCAPTPPSTAPSAWR